MADVKITALTAISSNPVNPATFPIPMVDLLDNAITASGTTKKVTVNQILGAGGTATLASATITGAATVGTTLGVTGASTLASVGVTGAATVGTTLGVTGNITGSGADPNLNNSSLNLFLSGGTTGDPAISFSRYGSASLNNRGAKIQYVFRAVGTQESGSLAFYSNPDGTGTGSLVERMRIDSTGALLVGTTSTGGSASNAAKTVGGSFSTVNGVSPSTATAVAVTLFTVPAEAVFIVSAFVPAYAAPTLYNAVSIVKVNGGVATVTALSTGTNISIAVSGLDVQATQLTGGASTISYSAIRIS